MKFQKGESVQIIKLSKIEFSKIYLASSGNNYDNYCIAYEDRFNMIGKITLIENDGYYVRFKDYGSDYFYEEELRLSINLKDKLELLKDLK